VTDTASTPTLRWLNRDESMLEVNLPEGTNWVKFNVGQFGYYRYNLNGIYLGLKMHNRKLSPYTTFIHSYDILKSIFLHILKIIRPNQKKSLTSY
jgi:hypothetical protein